MRLPISQHWSYLSQFPRYGDLLAENREFFYTPLSFNALAWLNPFEFLDELFTAESLGYPSVKIL